MALIVELDGREPQIGSGAFVAPNATLIGDVRLGDGANVWYGAVLRGDGAAIAIGAGCSIQDNAVIHCADDLPTVVGADVTVGHAAMLEGCTIGDRALIGMGAIVLQRARVGARALIAAGAVVGEGTEIGEAMLAAGVPARERKPLAGAAQQWIDHAAAAYHGRRDLYLRAARGREVDLHSGRG